MDAKARLIRSINHDLKNPLGALDGYAQILESGIKGELTPAQLETVARMRAAVRSAVKILDDLLELSLAQTGQLAIERTTSDIARVIHDSCERQRRAAEERGIALVLEAPLQPLAPIETDPVRVQQVLEHLLSNAIKYAPRGTQIRVRADTHKTAPAALAADAGRAARAGRATRAGRAARARRAKQQAAWLSVQVSDAGPGIPPALREQIFEEFYTVPGREHGTGLGLAIGRHVARLLGGDVTVGSGAGRGAVFTLWLPLG